MARQGQRIDRRSSRLGLPAARVAFQALAPFGRTGSGRSSSSASLRPAVALRPLRRHPPPEVGSWMQGGLQVPPAKPLSAMHAFGSHSAGERRAARRGRGGQRITRSTRPWGGAGDRASGGGWRLWGDIRSARRGEGVTAGAREGGEIVDPQQGEQRARRHRQRGRGSHSPRSDGGGVAAGGRGAGAREGEKAGGRRESGAGRVGGDRGVRC